jgi:hypothetical protein
VDDSGGSRKNVEQGYDREHNGIDYLYAEKKLSSNKKGGACSVSSKYSER